MSTAPVTLDFSKAQPINAAQGVTLDFSKAQPITGPGEQINDVGNRVIVPKEGESFSDTMKRAAAYGRTVSPAQINQEMATAPGKAAQTLGAAPVIGAVGAAGIAGAGEGAAATPAVMNALRTAAAAHPLAAEIIKQGLKGLGFGAGLKMASKFVKLSDLLGAEQ